MWRLRRNVSPWNIENPSQRRVSPPVQLPKNPQKGLDKPIHQSTSVFSLGGTKAAHQANRYERR